jgi:hypothetical protein
MGQANGGFQPASARIAAMQKTRFRGGLGRPIWSFLRSARVARPAMPDA